jgi:protein involved in polysaccharide export with SLBB domain
VPAPGGATKANAGTAVIGGVVSGATGGGLTKIGSGTLNVGAITLDAVNTYGGTAAGASALTLQGGTAPGITADVFPGPQFTLGGAVPQAGSTGFGAASARPFASGQYLVAPDGTVNLRQYGMVELTGKTIPEAKAVLEKHLAKYLDSPEVFVSVVAYNSKVYYIITQGAGMGDNVRRLPITGNETVLDAIAQINGLSQLSSQKIWITRPSPSDPEKGTILRVDYVAITRGGATATNYQVMPGDRIFIAEDGLIALNNRIGKITAPVERVLGIVGLAASTLRGLLFLPRGW